MIFGFGHRDTDYGVIVDVHSGSVGIAILHTEPGKKEPIILFSFREYIKILENPDTPGLVRALRHALFTASLQFSQEGLKKLKEYDPDARIGKILLSCGAPWAQTMTRFIHVEDKEPFLITEEKVKSLILEAERRDEEEMQAGALLKELNVTLVERAVVNTAVNGYFVENPYGKKGKELSLAHISGLIPKAIIEAIKDFEEKILMHVPRASHTFALVLFCVARDLYPKIRHGLFIDISGEATELCLMQEEVLMETHVLSYGTHTFVRDFALVLNTFPDEALGHLREYGENSPQKIKDALAHVTEAYVLKLEESIAALQEKYNIPNHIFLITSRNLDTYFVPIVQKCCEKYIGDHGSFTSLNTDILKEQTATEFPNKDIFFAIEARFFHKLHGCGEIT